MPPPQKRTLQLTCDVCGQRFAVPQGYSGSLTCPSCVAPASAPAAPPPQKKNRAAPLAVGPAGHRAISTGALAFLGVISTLLGVLSLLAAAGLLVLGLGASSAAPTLIGAGVGAGIAGLMNLGFGEAARVLIELEKRTR